MLKLNPAESDALVRSLDGLFDESNAEKAVSVELERRDSFDKPYPNGFLIVRVNWADGGWSEDAISERGSTSAWGSGTQEIVSAGVDRRGYPHSNIS